MIDISLDKSRAVRIKARVNEASVAQVLRFKNKDGSPHNISAYGFQLPVQKRANSSVKLFTLAIGSGLTVVGDDEDGLLIEVTKEQATQTADTYFWRLWSADEDHTWLNGPWEFHNGEHDAAVEEREIIIAENGSAVSIVVASGVTINNNSSGGGVTGWDNTQNKFPDGGVIQQYSRFIGSGSGSWIVSSAVGVAEVVNDGAEFIAKINNPGQDPDNWWYKG
jgi:hypothetical protein